MPTGGYHLPQDDLFYDKEGGGYYSNAAGDPSILLRMKEDYDGAEPSGNSIAASNLLRLSKVIAGDAGQEYRKRALHTMVRNCHILLRAHLGS